MSYIEIKALDYTYPKEQKKALNNINLSIKKGNIVLIIGRSGSGKSTLARSLTGAIPNFYGGTIGGEVYIDKKKVEYTKEFERARVVTMVFQDPEKQLFMNKVHREVAFALENTSVPSEDIKRRVWEALQFCNLLDYWDRDISTLSGGEKQRVAIAAAIAQLSNIIILDEPLSQLDPITSEEIVALIKKVNEELGITIIIVEQRLDRWFDIAEEIVLMEEGKISFKGSRESYLSEGYENFLPNYMRVFKQLSLPNIPKDFKEARHIIQAYDYSLELEEELNSDKKEKKGILTNLFVKPPKNLTRVLTIENLKVKYDNAIAVHSLDFHVDKGDFYFILGANGSGKSTLFKSIMNLVPYEGKLQSTLGEHKNVKTCDIAKYIGYVSQNPNDYISKDTVYDEIKFTLDNHKIPIKKEEIESLLKTLDIFHLMDKNPRDLSGGERQRIAIASILILNPEIILLDEPTRGLDWENKIKLGNLLKDLNRRGKTLVVITHDIDFAGEYGSKIAVMIKGSLVADGTSKKVLSTGIYYKSAISKLFYNKLPLVSFKDLQKVKIKKGEG